MISNSTGFCTFSSFSGINSDLVLLFDLLMEFLFVNFDKKSNDIFGLSESLLSVFFLLDVELSDCV